MRLVWSAKFTHSVKKLAQRKPDLLDHLELALGRLEENAHDAKLRTHKLSGDFEGCWACSAGYDLRILFEFVRSKHPHATEIHLLNVGTHDEIY